MKAPLKIWGLTGGIASGKSLAAEFFEQFGFKTLDADDIARELSRPGGGASREIEERFGTLERSKIRDIIFSDAKARKDLEAILHPKIQRESELRFQRFAQGGSESGPCFLLYEAALLVETGRYRDLEGLIVINASTESRRSRLLSREGWTPEIVQNVLGSQLADSEREAYATFVIRNDGTPEELRREVLRVAQKIRDESAQGA